MTLLARHALDWVIHGGLESLPADRELNHLLDIEYAVAPTYFDAFLTRDGGAKDAYDELKAILDTPVGKNTTIVENSLGSILSSKR